MSVRNSLLTVFSILSALALAASADDSRGTTVRLSTDRSALLLRSGRSVEGRISETETHYIVERSGGKVQVPKSDVEFIGENAEAVYRYKLSAINDQSAEDHIHLAEWCMLINLYDAATEQLERALQITPDSQRARSMLDAVHRAARTAEKNSAASPKPAKKDSELSSRDRPAFQQEVPATLISTFSVQVQPMLTRTCATAGCHDSSHSGSFILHRSPRPVAKLTQQNLRSVLVYVDPNDPDTSELLAYAIRPHGKLTVSPISKGMNDPAFVTLAEWVRAVCGKSSSKSSEPEPTRSELSVSARTPATAPKQPSADPVSKPPEREVGQTHLKLEDLPGGVHAHSNKPITPTASRIRAGMIAPSAPVAQAPTPAAQPEVQSIGTARSGTPNSSTKVESNKAHDSTVQTSQPTQASPPAAKGTPQAAAAPAPYQPIDPFDAEIFNRQFAPRLK